MKHKLIGQKVNLKITYRKIGDKEYPSYILDDPVMKKIIKDELGEGVRIFPPGSFGTANWLPFRNNVDIDKDGIITNVYKG